jgi:hypothetical protein
MCRRIASPAETTATPITPEVIAQENLDPPGDGFRVEPTTRQTNKSAIQYAIYRGDSPIGFVFKLLGQPVFAPSRRGNIARGGYRTMIEAVGHLLEREAKNGPLNQATTTSVPRELSGDASSDAPRRCDAGGHAGD